MTPCEICDPEQVLTNGVGRLEACAVFELNGQEAAACGVHGYLSMGMGAKLVRVLDQELTNKMIEALTLDGHQLAWRTTNDN